MSSVFEEYSTRALTADDWGAASALRLEALQKYPQFFQSSYTKEAAYEKEQWQGFFAQKNGRFIGLYHGKNLIGLLGVLTWWGDGTGETGVIVANYIVPAHQGRGLTAKLYEEGIAWARHCKSWKRLMVSHREGNDASKRAIQKWPFRFIEKSPAEWPDGTKGNDCSYILDLEELRAA